MLIISGENEGKISQFAYRGQKTWCQIMSVTMLDFLGILMYFNHFVAEKFSECVKLSLCLLSSVVQFFVTEDQPRLLSHLGSSVTPKGQSSH